MSDEDRPLECSECKRPANVVYTEMVGDTQTTFCMCAECPTLQRRLHGDLQHTLDDTVEKELGTGLCCGSCGMTLGSLRMGNPVGCAECYDVFADVIVLLLEDNLIKRSGKKKNIHVGRSPDEHIEINPSARLLALNEALNETLAREDYEQAAWLRDQIKAVTGKVDDKS